MTATIVFNAPASRALLPGFALTGCAAAAERAGYTVRWQLATGSDAAGGTDPLQDQLRSAGFAAHEGGPVDLLVVLEPERLVGSTPPISARKILCVEDRGGDAPRYDQSDIARRSGLGTDVVFMTTDRNGSTTAVAAVPPGDLFPLVVDPLVWRRPITPVPKGDAATVAVFRSDPLLDWLSSVPGGKSPPRIVPVAAQLPAPNTRDIRFPDQVHFYAETRRNAGCGPRLAALASGLVVLLTRAEAPAWSDAAICCQPDEMPDVLHRLSRYPEAYFEQAARGIAHVTRAFGAERFLKLLERQLAR